MVGRTTPYLPKETWRVVLRFATKGDLNILPDIPSAITEKYLQTKLSVSCVSRLWRSLSMEFLYEHIFIRRSSSIPMLKEVLATSHEASHGTSDPGLGWWVICLDLRPQQGPTIYNPTWNSLLADIAQYCPNLRGLRNTIYYLSKAIDTFPDSATNTLRSVNLVMPGRLDLPYKFLHKCAHLETLRVEASYIPTGISSTNELHLPHLRNLEIIGHLSDRQIVLIASSWRFPALHSLKLGHAQTEETLIRAWGNNLTELLVVYHGLPILEDCPSLCHLTLASARITSAALRPPQSVQLHLTTIHIYARDLDFPEGLSDDENVPADVQLQSPRERLFTILSNRENFPVLAQVYARPIQGYEYEDYDACRAILEGVGIEFIELDISSRVDMREFRIL